VTRPKSMGRPSNWRYTRRRSGCGAACSRFELPSAAVVAGHSVSEEAAWQARALHQRSTVRTPSGAMERDTRCSLPSVPGGAPLPPQLQADEQHRRRMHCEPGCHQQQPRPRQKVQPAQHRRTRAGCGRQRVQRLLVDDRAPAHVLAISRAPLTLAVPLSKVHRGCSPTCVAKAT
jgi:hypothetical protein